MKQLIFKAYLLIVVPLYLPIYTDTSHVQWSDYYTFKRASYVFNDLNTTYDETVAFCELEGGTPVSVQDDQENIFISLLTTKGNAYWLGLNLTSKTWLDNLPFTYSNFNESNESNATCTILTSSGNWLNLDCNLKAKSICKIDESQRCINNIGKAYNELKIKIIVLEDVISKQKSTIEELEDVCNLTSIEERIQNLSLEFDRRETEYIQEYNKSLKMFSNGLASIEQSTFASIAELQSSNNESVLELRNHLNEGNKHFETELEEAKEHLLVKIEKTVKNLEDDSICFNQSLSKIEETVLSKIRNLNHLIVKGKTKQNVVNNYIKDMFQFIYTQMEKIWQDIKNVSLFIRQNIKR